MSAATVTHSGRSHSAVSLLVYAVYLGMGGLTMALIPEQMLAFLQVRPSDGLWIRVAGCLASVLAIKGAYGALRESSGNMQLDVFTRTGFASFLTVLILLGIAEPPLFILAAIDYAASIWTQFALRADRKAGRFPS